MKINKVVGKVCWVMKALAQHTVMRDASRHGRSIDMLEMLPSRQRTARSWGQVARSQQRV